MWVIDFKTKVACRYRLHDMQGGLDFKLGDGEFDKIGLIAGGIGISPMVQIIREVSFAEVCVVGCNIPAIT